MTEIGLNIISVCLCTALLLGTGGLITCAAAWVFEKVIR